MIGIYKITNPIGKIYIGQSICIEDRFNSYKKGNNLKNQIKLSRSFIKYSIESHKFEIVEECELDKLNDRERFWQDFYNVIEKGLNCKLTSSNDRSGKLSDETCKLIKAKRKLQIMKPMSDETKKKISDANKGRTLSTDHIQKLKKPKSESHKLNMRGPRLSAKKPKVKIQCPHCQKTGAPNVMKRFHFENCGIKQHNTKIQCPHCQKIGDGGNMKRWHFDNCKNK